MARKRMIDPSIWADEDFGSLSPEAQVLYIGIISNADDEGRLPANPAFLSASIFPFKGLTAEQAKDIRSEVLTRMKSAILYIVDGKEYIELKKWYQYQAINRPTPSKYPKNEAKSEQSLNTHAQLTEDSVSNHGGLTPNRIEKNRKELIETKETDKSLSFLDDKGVKENNRLGRAELVRIAEERSRELYGAK